MSEATVKTISATLQRVALELSLVEHDSWGFGLGGGGSRRRSMLAGGIDFGRYGLRLRVERP